LPFERGRDRRGAVAHAELAVDVRQLCLDCPTFAPIDEAEARVTGRTRAERVVSWGLEPERGSR
jgi:hypothetical protein